MRKSIMTAAMAVFALILAGAVLTGISNISLAAGLSFPNADRYSAGDAEIRETVNNLDIDWINGKVTVEYHTKKTIELREQSAKPIEKDMQMRWWLDGDTLRVHYAKAGFRLKGNQQKELTVVLPEGMSFSEVNISATSGELSIPSLQAERMTLATTSGDISADGEASKISAGATSGNIELKINGKSKEISAGTTSGSVAIEAGTVEELNATCTSGRIRIAAEQADQVETGTISGSINLKITDAGKIKAGSTSGDITANLEKADSVKVNTTSGAVSVSLPEDPGFTAYLETVSGAIRYDIPLTKQGSSYICGDGSVKVEIGTTSGNITLGTE